MPSWGGGGAAGGEIGWVFILRRSGGRTQYFSKKRAKYLKYFSHDAGQPCFFTVNPSVALSAAISQQRRAFNFSPLVFCPRESDGRGSRRRRQLVSGRTENMWFLVPSFFSSPVASFEEVKGQRQQTLLVVDLLAPCSSEQQNCKQTFCMTCSETTSFPHDVGLSHWTLYCAPEDPPTPSWPLLAKCPSVSCCFCS